MGKQVNFYMTEDDESVFLQYLHSERNIRIVKRRYLTSEIVMLDHFTKLDEPWSHRCYLWDADHSPPPVLEYIDTQNYYLVDEYKSEVIHFDRTMINKSIRDYDPDKPRFAPGRIFIDHKIWVGNVLTERPKAFLDWYEKIARWIRKNGVYRAKGGYVFPGMVKFLEENPNYSVW